MGRMATRPPLALGTSRRSTSPKIIPPTMQRCFTSTLSFRQGQTTAALPAGAAAVSVGQDISRPRRHLLRRLRYRGCNSIISSQRRCWRHRRRCALFQARQCAAEARRAGAQGREDSRRGAGGSGGGKVEKTAAVADSGRRDRCSWRVSTPSVVSSGTTSRQAQ
jgi:hypothetical protein